MSKVENKLLDFIEKYKYYIFLSVVFLLGLYVRYINLHFETPDYKMQLEVWYNQLGKNGGGFSSLGNQVGNYNSLYQFIICLLTYIPIKPIIAYKGLSIIFDILLAIESRKLVYLLTNDEYKANIAFAVIYICPIVIMNSAFWSQCDSIFTYFALLCVRMMYQQKPYLSLIFFGISFAFKLQAIFVFPLLALIYLIERKLSIKHFVVAFIVFYCSGIPSFIFGRVLTAPIDNYLYQMSQYEKMGLNIINFWTLLDVNYVEFNYIAILITLVIFVGAWFYLSEMKNKDISNHYLELAVWGAWTCVLFLPSMHDRYSYAAEIFLILLCIKNLKYIVPTFIQLTCSFQTYSYYLFEKQIQIPYLLSMFLILSYLWFAYSIFKEIKRHNL